MILCNEVPPQLLELYRRCIESGECPVPEGYRRQVLGHIDRAIAGDDTVARFFVLITALHQCKRVRDAIAAPSGSKQLEWWLNGPVSRAWGDFFLGSGVDGAASCASMSDARHHDVLGFVARLQADFMSYGWATPTQ